jgi:hypothetical protein
MENKPLPEIVCPKCHKIQSYTKQTNCKSCGERFSNWNLFNQLHKDLPLATKLRDAS